MHVSPPLPARAHRWLGLIAVAVAAAFLLTTVVAVRDAAAATVRGGLVRTGGAAAALGGPADFGSAAAGTAIVSSPSGGGYLVADERGAVFAFGDAVYRGGVSGPLNRPIVGMASTPSGGGYWLVASDGGVFAFGDARFFGSTGSIRLNQPIVGMASTPSGGGYWLVASDGGVFAFGNAGFHGSAVGAAESSTTVEIQATSTGSGYWMIDDRGVVSSFGDAPAVAAVADHPPATDVASAAIRPQGDGVWALLVPQADDPRFPPVPAGSGSGRRIVYSNSDQRVWLVEENGRIYDSYLVSGRQGVPRPGTYSVFSKSEVAWSGNLVLDHMVRFTWGQTLAIGFHAIPTDPRGQPVQSLDELGRFRSAGCIRQDPAKAEALFHWAPVGTTVVVLP